MLRGLRDRRARHWAGGVGALLAVIGVALAPAGVSAQAPAQATVLAQGREELAAGEWLFRVNDNVLPPGEPGVTHAHASGFDYAVEGTHVLTVDGAERVAAQGQATWVGPQQEHTHGSLNRAGMRFWFVAFRPAATRGVPGTWPYPQARIRGESEDVRLAAAGEYELVLSEVRLPAPGAVAGPLARTGPVGVTVVAGAVRFGGEAIPAEGVVVQHPGDARAFTNSGPGPAHLLVLAVTPAQAAPTRLPRTGGFEVVESSGFGRTGAADATWAATPPGPWAAALPYLCPVGL
jgi:quercetin dioxygenase-like cupin family protein